MMRCNICGRFKRINYDDKCPKCVKSIKKKFKIGTKVRLTEEYVKWLSNWADEGHAYPNLTNTAKDALEYHIDRYSHEKDLDICGKVVRSKYTNNYINDNADVYIEYKNRLGKATSWINPGRLIIVEE